jgi:hypothetical protein
MSKSREAAALSGWSQNYISILSRKGILPGIRTKTRWLVDEAALRAHVSKMRSQPCEATSIVPRGNASTTATTSTAQ